MPAVSNPNLPAMVVGVPARDETETVADCVRSLLTAADQLSSACEVRIVIACDSCGDDTAEVARAEAADDPRCMVVEGRWGAAGGARRTAIEHGLLDVAATSLRDVWIATTDADTVVPVDWLQRHATWWANGDHAVAGTVELRPDGHLTPAIADEFARTYLVGADEHAHVHGANLGIRGDVYVAAGGVAPIALAEDHALWAAVQLAGYRCRSAVSPVATSARLWGRARGGFADTLRAQVAGATS